MEICRMFDLFEIVFLGIFLLALTLLLLWSLRELAKLLWGKNVPIPKNTEPESTVNAFEFAGILTIVIIATCSLCYGIYFGYTYIKSMFC